MDVVKKLQKSASSFENKMPQGSNETLRPYKERAWRKRHCNLSPYCLAEQPIPQATHSLKSWKLKKERLEVWSPKERRGELSQYRLSCFNVCGLSDLWISESLDRERQLPSTSLHTPKNHLYGVLQSVLPIMLLRGRFGEQESRWAKCALVRRVVLAWTLRMKRIYK